MKHNSVFNVTIPSSIHQTHAHTPTPLCQPNTDTTHIPPRVPTPTLYLRELLEGQLEAAPVVGGALGSDALHSIFQHPLVADVGLHQVLKARRVRGLVIELEGRGKEG